MYMYMYVNSYLLHIFYELVKVSILNQCLYLILNKLSLLTYFRDIEKKMFSFVIKIANIINTSDQFTRHTSFIILCHQTRMGIHKVN